MPLIESSDYDFIRKEVHSSANATSLPDTLIQLREAIAVRWVAKRVADLDDIAESEDEDDVERYAHAKLAALYYCAHLIAPTWSPPTSESISGAGAAWTQQVIPPAANAAQLKTKAETELDAATEEEEAAPRVGRSGSAVTVARW